MRPGSTAPRCRPRSGTTQSRVGRPIGGRGQSRGGARLVVEAEVSVIYFQCQGSQRRTVESTSLGAVCVIIVGVPTAGRMAIDPLAADELVADLGVPTSPGLAAMLVHRQGAVIPIIEVVG